MAHGWDGVVTMTKSNGELIYVPPRHICAVWVDDVSSGTKIAINGLGVLDLQDNCERMIESIDWNPS